MGRVEPWSKKRARAVSAHIGKLLLRARSETGLTQAAVADAAGLHRPIYSRLESGTRCFVPTLETLWRASQALDICVAELMVELDSVRFHQGVDEGETAKLPAIAVEQWTCERSHAWVKRGGEWVCKRCDLVEGVANA